MSGVVQLDLFGQVEACEAEHAERDRRRREWADQLRGEVRPLPYDCGLGRKGDLHVTWVCPACGGVELTRCCLWLNHGYHPDWPDHRPYTWTQLQPMCHRMFRQRGWRS